VVEAGDILAGEDSAGRSFAKGPNKTLTAGSDVDTQLIQESRMLETDHWRAQLSRESVQELPVGDDPDQVKESWGSDESIKRMFQ
jgi:hypothetical protein